MRGNSHVVIAAAAYVALWVRPLALGPEQVAPAALSAPFLPTDIAALGAGTAVVALAALAPDLDKAGSGAARLGGLPTRVLAWGLEHTVGHRGPLHGALAIVAVYLLAGALGGAVGVGGLGAVAAFGWAAHLLADAVTVRGVPLLWPLPFRLRLPPFLTTGSLGETLAVAATVLASGWWAATSDRASELVRAVVLLGTGS
jgi:inner membrane protein